ncbi:hypothetical protein [Streptomyces sasae]|uniref:hypothetical protein n=1 Tax=Streptomyces sasae TaxID=1266772 RepID=UPI00292EEFFD|nr:hypothetical protein [Streptomyces sasae]
MYDAWLAPHQDVESAVPRWVVLQAEGEAEVWRYTVRRELEGSETEALAATMGIVDSFAKAHTERGRRGQRRQVFRVSERRYFVRVRNRISRDQEAHFALAELVADSHDDGLPDTVGG